MADTGIQKKIFSLENGSTQLVNFLTSSNFFTSIETQDRASIGGITYSKRIACKQDNDIIIEFYIGDGSTEAGTHSSALLSKVGTLIHKSGSSFNVGLSGGIHIGYSTSKGIVLKFVGDDFFYIMKTDSTPSNFVILSNKKYYDENRSYYFKYSMVKISSSNDTAVWEIPLGYYDVSTSSDFNSLLEQWAPMSDNSPTRTVLVPSYTKDGTPVSGLYQRAYSPRDVAMLGLCVIDFGEKQYVFDGNWALEE